MVIRHYDPDTVAVAAQVACLLEASAEKPGNVTPTRGFADLDYEDFLRAAAAIGPEMARAGTRGVGETVWAAVTATRRWTRTNVNLGIILLLAPLARAALLDDPTAEGLDPADALRARLRRVLRDLTVEDARYAYAAIRLAAPGGLGTVERHDVRTEPTVTLREAMAAAADRDSIAAEYVTDYAITFERARPAFRQALARGLSYRQAAVQVFLELLAVVPDTLIARKAGRPAAEAVSRQAARVVAAGGVFTEAGRRALARLDRRLRRDGHRLNPGTTADLVAAALFVILLEGEQRTANGE